MSSPNFSERIANWLISRRAILLGVGILIAIAAYFPASDLRFDRSIENMFAADDPLLEPFQSARRRFGAGVCRDEENNPCRDLP